MELQADPSSLETGALPSSQKATTTASVSQQVRTAASALSRVSEHRALENSPACILFNTFRNKQFGENLQFVSLGRYSGQTPEQFDISSICPNAMIRRVRDLIGICAMPANLESVRTTQTARAIWQPRILGRANCVVPIVQGSVHHQLKPNLGENGI